jgi:hypothetical protein
LQFLMQLRIVVVARKGRGFPQGGHARSREWSQVRCPIGSAVACNVTLLENWQ